MDVVISLVDKSFVRPLAGDRYDLLVSVQAYAVEHLNTESRYNGSGAAAHRAAMLRHAQWYARLGPVRAVLAACADLDNMVAACKHATSDGNAELAAGALSGAWGALALRGPFSAGVELAQSVCAMPGLRAMTAAQARMVLGHALECAGQRGLAATQYASALQHARESGDAHTQAEVLVRQGGLRGYGGKAELDAALQLAIDVGDRALECSALNGLGTLEFEQGRMVQAQVHYAAALVLARRIGHRRWEGSLLGNLGNLYANQGAMDAAREHAEGALAIARELGDRRREGNGLSNLAMLNYLQGRLAEAAGAAESAHRAACDLGHVALVGAALGNLGLIYGALGRHAHALSCLQEALGVARAGGNARVLGQILSHLGLAQARLSQFAAAASSLAEAGALLQKADDELGLTLLVCHRAEFAWLSGEGDDAIRHARSAAALALAAGAGPESELGLALARLHGLMHTALSDQSF